MLRGLPYQTLHFDRYNLGDRALNFESLWRWDRNKRRVGLRVSGPIGLSPHRGYRLLLDARDEDWDLRGTFHGSSPGPNPLELRRIEAGGDIVFTLRDKLDWTTGLRLALRRFQNTGGNSLFGDGWSFVQRNQFQYRLLDVPERRLRVDSSAILRTGRVLASAGSRFAILEGDISGIWWPQSAGDTWKVYLRMRTGETWGRPPFDEYFQLGMERDNDLWLRGRVGTRDGRKGNAPLGTTYALLQTGFNRTIAEIPFLKLRAGPFFDAGRITDPSGRLGSLGWRPAAGIQTDLEISGGITWSFVYGHDLRGGGAVFYTAVSR